MTDIASNIYFRAVNREKQNHGERMKKKRKLFLAPTERSDRDKIIEDSIKYSRLKK